MIIVIGEILIDRFPNYERIGGAPFNFAFHLKQSGWPVRLITRIGDDAPGRQILQLLKQHHFYLRDVQIDPHHPTGRVDVELDTQGVPQFDICRNVAYDYIDLSALPTQDLSMAKMIYFGTLAQRTPQGFNQYQACLDQKGNQTLGFCDINFRPPHLNETAIMASLQQADILKLNSEELDRIGVICQGPDKADVLLAWLLQTYSISLIALTDGSRGSQAITKEKTVSATPQSEVDIIDTVGAGDGYAAALASGVLDNWPLKKTLELATEFAATICTLPGAIPPDHRPYQKLRQKLGKKA
jgi:fructokinase